MNNPAATFFDDIVKTLSIEAESATFANISPEVLQEFNADIHQGTPSLESKNQFAGNVKTPPRAVVDVQPPTGGIAPFSQGQKSASAPFPQVSLDPFAESPPAVKPSPTNVVPANLSGMDMNSLLQTVRACEMCRLCSERKNVVFGAGAANADLMFIGEGPGRDEDQQGVPFVGEAGQLLTKMINAMQFSRSEVYIANIIKCRPPRNRNPEDDEAAACLPYLRRQIDIISPKVIVLLGAVPLKYLMGVTGITRARGIWLDYNGIKVMPTFHPAYLLRNLHLRKEVWEDLQKVMMLFGKSHSSVTRR